MTRTALLLLVLALYATVLGRGPAARAMREAGFDPLSPQASAVDQLMVDGRLDEARSVARALAEKYPGHPQIAYWLASIDQRLGHYREAADAWSEYVRTSAAPADACPAWPDAYDRSGQPDRASAVAARCEEWTRR